jgi:diguanylate cyclase (GGDEF)-like protein/PAS domain S-box-containing protein
MPVKKLPTIHDSHFIKRIAANAAASGSWGIVACAEDRTIVWANEAAHSLLSSKGRLLSGQKLLACDAPEALKFNGLLQVTVSDDNVKAWIFASSSTFEDVTLICFSDASDVAQHISALSYTESIWRHAVQSAGQGVWEYNANNVAQFQSDEWKNLRGFPLDKPVVDSFEQWLARLHPDDVEATREHVRKHNAGEVDQFSFEYREKTVAGNYVWILATGRVVERKPDGTAVRIIGTDIDITHLKAEEENRREELRSIHKEHVAELEKAHECTEAARQVALVLSRQDPMTNLQNRRVFSEEIAALARDSDNAPFAILVVDLDRFKPVNDLYGHTVGDFILKSAAERMLQATGPNGIVARIGGDEFGVILRPSEKPIQTSAMECARAIIGSLCEPIRIGSFEVEIGASIGIALFPEHGRDHLSLFKHADMALYHIKQSQKGRYHFYSDEIGAEAEAKASLETAVRQAITNNEIIPHFQPIYDLRTNELVGFEVLSRWSNEQFGNVPPDRFIPIIDHFNLMPQLTQSILDKACKAALTWGREIPLSINVSAKEVCDLSTPVRLLKTLRQNGIKPTTLKVEVTEQALMHDMATARDVINALRKSGIKVMLDDFGSGYAGLGYLREFKFDSIKIDKSFVLTSQHQKESAKIVGAIQTLAKHLELQTVAEGIENEQTLRFLKRIGCDLGQGYHFSKPVPASEIPGLLEVSSTPAAKIA